MYAQSTANEWTIDCPSCGRGVILDERCLGPAGIVCPDCQLALDVAQGRWVPRNPDATWGHGFWVNHLMVPWISKDEVLDRQRTYDLARFKNEVLGLPTSLGDHAVTRAELERCCTERPMAGSMKTFRTNFARACVRNRLGWRGNSRTVVVLGYMRDDYVFDVCYFARYQADEDPNRIVVMIAELASAFGIQYLAADGGGNGSGLQSPAPGTSSDFRTGCMQFSIPGQGQPPHADGMLMKWSVDRTASISTLFGRIKSEKLLFPRAADCGSFLDECSCELAEYDESNRSIRYTHPATMQDDGPARDQLRVLTCAAVMGAMNVEV